MFTQVFFRKWLMLELLVVLVSMSCTSPTPLTTSNSPTTSPGSQTTALKSSNIGDIANEIAKGVGSVQRAASTGEKGPLFVFEEFHTSRIGQLQIAIMLLRLREKYGLKKIGLEGAIQSGRPLDASWFRGMGGSDAKQEREDLTVRWLAEGEIGSSEFMTFNFPDVEVYGIESASEYNIEPPKTNPEAQYLLAIAGKSLTTADQEEVGTLLQRGRKEEAFEYMINANPWVKERYEALKKQSVTSSGEEIARLRELKDKAREVGAKVTPEAEKGLEALIGFYETADRRSSTMVNSILELPGVAAGVPSATTIGAAHTDKVIELLTQRNVAFAVIRPKDLNPEHGTMTGEQFERKSNGKWARNSQGTLGRVLNGSRKPSPILERASAHSYASMLMAGMLVAKLGRGGGGGLRFPPDDVWSRLRALPDIRLDRDSFTRDGYDVIYRAWLKQDDGQEKEVWARVGTLNKSPSANTIKTLEQKLLQASDDLRGGGIIPPTDLPPNSEAADDEGPRDGKRKGVVISRTGRDSLAIFAASRASVLSVGQISD